MTKLAGDRYTKAYVSALETGHSKPSMAALNFFADRLGTELVADELVSHFKCFDTLLSDAERFVAVGAPLGY